MSKKIGIIIQARLGSSRLPGKILLPAGGKSLLEIQVDRLKKTGIKLIIATTGEKTDDRLEEFCLQHKLPYFRGDEQNVLKRYYSCAELFGLQVVVRITSDCPLIDESLVKKSIDSYLQFDDPNVYLSNTIERTYPRGFDFEIFSFELLREAFLNAVESGELEHVTPYIWKNKSGRVIIKQLTNSVNDSNLRLTVDTSEDYLLIRTLVEKYDAADMNGNEITELLRSQPSLVNINAHVEQKKI